MSITTYQTLAARELLDAIGWPEWGDNDSSYYTLTFDAHGSGSRWSYVNRICQGWGVDAHVALCLLRNHLREFIWAWIARAPVCPYDDDALLAACEEALAENLAEEADDGNTA